MAIWACFPFLAIMNKAVGNIHLQVLGDIFPPLSSIFFQNGFYHFTYAPVMYKKEVQLLHVAITSSRLLVFVILVVW